MRSDLHLIRQAVAVLFFIVFAFSCTKDKEDTGEIEVIIEKPVKPIRYTGSYTRDFNDINDVQLTAATQRGIKPIKDRAEAEGRKKDLVEISDTDTYLIDNLTHSIPFLVPRAAELLNKIGENFRDSLDKLDAPHYKLIVTSVTRTQDDVKRLRKSNVNSTENSAHMYGTTFDITWVRFQKDSKRITEVSPAKLKMVLAMVLRDLRKERYCYVKHETRQGCFHITVR